MGHIRHHAIIITTWSDEIEKVKKYLDLLPVKCSEIVLSGINDYKTILIAPDGSKEGWGESDTGDAYRSMIKKYLTSFRYSDGSSPIEWCEVAYGNDDQDAAVLDSEWKKND